MAPSQNPKSKIQNHHVRPYHPGDEDALVLLFERVFKRTISAAHWRWKLKTLASPVENVWLAVDGETPIFQYAGIPCRYHLPGGEKTVMVSVDTMTAPRFRRRGLLTEVGDFTYEVWREGGVPFVLGLPNEKWGSRTEALGWKTLFPLQWLVRPLRPEKMLARRVKLPFLARLTWPGKAWNAIWRYKVASDATIRARQVDRAGPEFDTLWQTILSEAPVSVIRDRAWVTWRYLTPPMAQYRLLLAKRGETPVGYAAYRLRETPDGKIGLLAELSTGRADIAGRNTLISKTVEAIQAEDAEAIFTLAVPNTPLYRAFQGAGFILKRPSFIVQLVPLDPALRLDILADPNNWRIAGGDFDVI